MTVEHLGLRRVFFFRCCQITSDSEMSGKLTVSEKEPICFAVVRVLHVHVRDCNDHDVTRRRRQRPAEVLIAVTTEQVQVFTRQQSNTSCPYGL